MKSSNKPVYYLLPRSRLYVSKYLTFIEKKLVFRETLIDTYFAGLGVSLVLAAYSTFHLIKVFYSTKLFIFAFLDVFQGKSKEA